MRRVNELAKKAEILRADKMVKTRGMGAQFRPEVQTSDGHCPVSRQADVQRRSRRQGNYAVPLRRPYLQIGLSPASQITTSRDHLRKGVKFTATQHEMPRTKQTTVIYIGVSVGCTA